MHTKPFDPKQHWEAIYAKKDPQELSWFQAMPKVSLDLLAEHRVPPAARIIDVGGGDSLLVDHLLERGYSEVTVLDISGTALARAQRRLGAAAATVQWIEGDATCFEAAAPFDVWHDRAVFHFLTNDAAVERYLERLSRLLRPGGLLILGTFSENGPEKCSGIPVRRYSEAAMVERLQHLCARIRCSTVDHVTPSGKVQNFLFCAFRRVEQD